MSGSDPNFSINPKHHSLFKMNESGSSKFFLVCVLKIDRTISIQMTFVLFRGILRSVNTQQGVHHMREITIAVVQMNPQLGKVEDNLIGLEKI